MWNSRGNCCRFFHKRRDRPFRVDILLHRMRFPVSFALLALPLIAQEPVRYEFSFPNAAHHEAEIRATFSGIRQPVLELVMSNSSPGRYAIHEFAKNV